MNLPTIFITYNPDSPAEQAIATRLHTLGVVSGFTMLLPDRNNSVQELQHETAQRIFRADFIVMFSLGELSPLVRSEINYALQVGKNKSDVVVVYPSKTGKNLSGTAVESFTSYYLDMGNPQVHDDTLRAIIQNLQLRWHKKEETRRIEQEIQRAKDKSEADKFENMAIGGLIGLGVGLLLLAAVKSE